MTQTQKNRTVSNTNRPLKGLDKSKSLRPKKRIKKNKRGYGLKKIIQMTLGLGNMQVSVELPIGEDMNEWIAVNVIGFYNDISLLYGLMTEFCTTKSCPKMTAGPSYIYCKGFRGEPSSAQEISAPSYINYIMEWVESTLENEQIFPEELDQLFPSNFITVIRNMFKRLFRVYAHMYHSHYKDATELKFECHKTRALNTLLSLQTISL